MTTTMLSNTQVERFAEEGYLLFDDLLDPEDDLDPIIEEYESVLDRIASELYEQGETISRYDGLPFGERLTRITNETGKSLVRFFSPYLPPRNTERDTPFWAGPAVFNAIRNDKIMDALEPLIGGEIYASPIQNVRLKIPEHLLPRDPKTGAILDGATPWHQDGAFFEPEVDGVDMVTVWFPLSDATIENGCLAGPARKPSRGVFRPLPPRHQGQPGRSRPHSRGNLRRGRVAADAHETRGRAGISSPHDPRVAAQQKR